MKTPIKKQRTKSEIRADIAKTYTYYKGLKAGSPAFKNVSKKLESLSRELEAAKK